MSAPYSIAGGVPPGVAVDPHGHAGPADRVGDQRGPLRGNRPPFVIPEDVRAAVASIRNQLVRRVGAGANPVVGLASSVPGEGATTTLVLLAASLVESGRRVVAVDANPDRGLTRVLGVDGVPGRGSPGPGPTRAWDAIPTAITGLSLLLWDEQGAAAQEPDAWRSLLDGLWARGEMILVDLPPALGPAPMPEEALAAMDGVVLVVAAHRTRRETVIRARQELERASNRELLGVVLNARQYFIPEIIYRHA